MDPLETITAFDSFLSERGLSFDGIVVGAAALGLLGIVSRQTEDCDVLDPIIPDAILAAARDFAALSRQAGGGIEEDWLNNGPISLAKVLPEGWRLRTQLAFKGKAMTLHALGRSDLLGSKLFALCDRDIDMNDCIALRPTKGELEELLPWVEYQDANPLWPAHVRKVLGKLARRLGYEF